MIQFNDVASQWREIEGNTSVDHFLSKGPYILGRYVKKFEYDFSDFCGAKYATGVSSGTDALKLAIQAVRNHIWSRPHKSPLDIVIPANAHISSALAPAYFSHLTSLIDCDENHNIDIDKLEKHAKQSDNHKIIIVTHMYGNPVDMKRLMKCLPPYCYVIEDCSHAHGATIDGQHVGTFGEIGIFSLYPTKNLGAYGDAGIAISNKSEYCMHLNAYRNYGSYGNDDCQGLGWNDRLDELQALILHNKLPHLKKWNSKRYGIAKLYNEYLKDVGDLILPPLTDGRVFHIYQIRTSLRDPLQSYLKKRDIPTLIHYPVPIYKTEMFHHLNGDPETMPRTETLSREILSLPIHPYLKMEEVKTICDNIKEFYSKFCMECGGYRELMEDNERYICRWCIRRIAGEKTDLINPSGRYRQI